MEISITPLKRPYCSNSIFSCKETLQSVVHPRVSRTQKLIKKNK